MKNFEKIKQIIGDEFVAPIAQDWDSPEQEKEAEQKLIVAISEIVEEIIGKDEDDTFYARINGSYPRQTEVKMQNKLREEQRQKAISYGLEIKKGKHE